MLNVQARVQIQRQEMQQSAQSARKNVSASPNLTCHCGCKVGRHQRQKGISLRRLVVPLQDCVVNFGAEVACTVPEMIVLARAQAYSLNAKGMK